MHVKDASLEHAASRGIQGSNYKALSRQLFEIGDFRRPYRELRRWGAVVDGSIAGSVILQTKGKSK